ncbi:MAG: aldolase/citrate lyase family protein, partial [Chloroflexota bacterium]
GAYGVIAPRVSTVEGARAIVSAVRYPRPDEDAILAAKQGKVSRGLRGWGLHKPARYWGLTLQEYYDRSGLWPVDPAGDLCLIGMIETLEGLNNLPDILSQVEGFAGIIVGIDDLAMDMGYGIDINHPEPQRAMEQVLAICTTHGIACGAVTDRTVIEQRVEQGFRILLIPPEHSATALQLGRAVALRVG